MYFELNWSNVGYCDPSGCKVAAENLFAANGITKDRYGKVYVGSAGSGRIYVTERQTDNRLVVTDVIPLGAYLRLSGSECYSDRE